MEAVTIDKSDAGIQSVAGRRGLVANAHIIACGTTPVGTLGLRPTVLMRRALERALGHAGLPLRQLDGLVAVPSLAEPHFMEAHFLATQMGLLPRKDVIVRTIDTGGAGPITGLLEAARLIDRGWCDLVAVVAGDALRSLSREEFLRRADRGCQDPHDELPSPVIPNGYDRVARWQMDAHGVTREQLAMASVLMSRQACRHPDAMTEQPHTLESVLSSTVVAPVTTVLECARRADGGAAVLVASARLLEKVGFVGETVAVVGGGEGSGPLYPPPVIDEDMFSCEEACAIAYGEAELVPEDIDFFGLYDCFPICLLRAVEAVGLALPGRGGDWLEQKYHETADMTYAPDVLPVNTHGGLLAFAAPWEAPAMYNVVEAFAQLTRQADRRQLSQAKRGLVYGNGGIFSASAVAVLEHHAWPASYCAGRSS